MRELAPKHEEHWFEIYGKIALTGQPARFENRAEQLHRWYDVFAFRVGRPEDRQVAILFNDITERKRAEETLATSEKRFRDVADHSREWIWEVDAEGKYTYSSRIAEEILGYTTEEILQKHFYDFFHPDDREALQAAALATFAAKQAFTATCTRAGTACGFPPARFPCSTTRETCSDIEELTRTSPTACGRKMRCGRANEHSARP
jgi:PAS domain-containing protein